MSRRLTRGLAAGAVLALAACQDDTRADELLPAATSATGAIPTGDLAGPADRAALGLGRSPYAGDQGAIREGERLFLQMNCADCHGYDARGGMGPDLVDGEWLFGETSADRFSSVHGGRARGMPAYGELLPDESIWKVVAYIESLGTAAAEARRAGGVGQGEARDASPAARH